MHWRFHGKGAGGQSPPYFQRNFKKNKMDKNSKTEEKLKDFEKVFLNFAKLRESLSIAVYTERRCGAVTNPGGQEAMITARDSLSVRLHKYKSFEAVLGHRAADSRQREHFLRPCSRHWQRCK